MPSKKAATARGTRRYKKVEGPFHVVTSRAEDFSARYAIMVNNAPFLGGPAGWEPTDETGVVREAPKLTRPIAYAITRLLNAQRATRVWGNRFGDPYIAHREPTP